MTTKSRCLSLEGWYVRQRDLGSRAFFYFVLSALNLRLLQFGGGVVNSVKMPTNFKPPVDVAPLIRFGRWSLLILGVSYGAFFQRKYTNYELSIKDEKDKAKAERDARIAAEKKRKADADIADLEKMAKGSK